MPTSMKLGTRKWERFGQGMFWIRLGPSILLIDAMEKRN
jgi:hypothetical protein